MKYWFFFAKIKKEKNMIFLLEIDNKLSELKKMKLKKVLKIIWNKKYRKINNLNNEQR